MASIWTVALLLTGYCGTDLNTWVRASPSMDGSELVHVTGELQAFSDAIGLGPVHDDLERVRARIHKGSDIAEAPVRRPPPIAARVAPAPTISSAIGGAGGSVARSADPIAAVKPPPHAVKQALVIGASSIQFELGVLLEEQLQKHGVTVKRFGRAATGLTQPEILNWPSKLEKLLDGFSADTVIINFGGNDALAIQVGAHDWIEWENPKWGETYGARVADLVERCKKHGAVAVVIGMPMMRARTFGQRMRALNQITKQYTEGAGGVYLSQWEYSGTKEGRYREYIDMDGQRRLMRNEDGIHYSRWGAAYVARLLVDDLAQQFSVGKPPDKPAVAAAPAPAPAKPDRTTEAAPVGSPDKLAAAPAAPAAAPAVPTTAPAPAPAGVEEHRSFPSRVIGRDVDYIVWRPRDVQPNTPVLVMLHGAGADPKAFEVIGPQLSALAGELGVLLIAPDGGGDGWWLDAPERKHSKWETMVVKELPAALAKVWPGAAIRGALGYSMGGHGALGLALRHPGFVRSASSLSGVVDLTLAGSRHALVQRLGSLDDERARWEAHSVIHLVKAHPERLAGVAIRFGCGTRDPWIGANRALHAELDRRAIHHSYEERDAAHDWAYWGTEIPAQVRWHVQQWQASEPPPPL